MPRPTRQTVPLDATAQLQPRRRRRRRNITLHSSIDQVTPEQRTSHEDDVLGVGEVAAVGGQVINQRQRRLVARTRAVACMTCASPPSRTRTVHETTYWEALMPCVWHISGNGWVCTAPEPSVVSSPAPQPEPFDLTARSHESVNAHALQMGKEMHCKADDPSSDASNMCIQSSTHGG